MYPVVCVFWGKTQLHKECWLGEFLEASDPATQSLIAGTSNKGIPKGSKQSCLWNKWKIVAVTTVLIFNVPQRSVCCRLGLPLGHKWKVVGPS
jgi:hypothetical protein